MNWYKRNKTQRENQFNWMFNPRIVRSKPPERNKIKPYNCTSKKFLKLKKKNLENKKKEEKWASKDAGFHTLRFRFQTQIWAERTAARRERESTERWRFDSSYLREKRLLSCGISQKKKKALSWAQIFGPFNFQWAFQIGVLAHGKVMKHLPSK